jgi:hypothetical protein
LILIELIALFMIFGSFLGGQITGIIDVFRQNVVIENENFISVKKRKHFRHDPDDHGIRPEFFDRLIPALKAS